MQLLSIQSRLFDFISQLSTKKIFVLFFFFAAPLFCKAQSSPTDDSDKGDNFDPFADYSEYDQTAQEESDIYFLRHGRMVNIAISGGLRSFTDVLKTLYSSGPTYGLAINYFFDLRFAGYMGFLTGDHAFQLTTDTTQLNGNISMTFMSLGLKYYFDTDFLIRPIAQLNPYWNVGLNQSYRTLSLSSSDTSAQDSTLGLEVGVGIEIPILRNEAYFGLQSSYRYFSFKDETQNLIDPDSLLPINVKPSGDSLDILVHLGLNF